MWRGSIHESRNRVIISLEILLVFGKSDGEGTPCSLRQVAFACLLSYFILVGDSRVSISSQGVCF